MPRKPRFFVPGYAAHLVQRGNNRSVTFFEQEDYELYLSLLIEAAFRYGALIHCYVLMTNHVHLLATPEKPDSLSRMMQYIGRHYVAHVNQKYRRSGTLWEGRFKACPVAEERYVLSCYRYIEMNPVRAGMVAAPGEYEWSSYRLNAGLERGDVLTEHAAYIGLGESRGQRTESYRKLFIDSTDDAGLEELRQCLQSGTPFCDERFRREIEAALSMKVGQVRRGRPRKHLDAEKGL